MSSDPNFQLPVAYREALAIGKQSRAAALGLLAWDHWTCFDREVEVIWKQGGKKRFGFWLYLFNRFFPLVWLVFDMIPLAPAGIVSPSVCIIYLMCDDIVTLLTTLSVQVILQIRVYALYNRSRRILIFLAVCCALEICTMIILIGVTMKHISRLPVVSTSTGCYYEGIFSIYALFWIPALVFEPVLCMLVVWKAWGEDAMVKFGLVARDKIGSTTPKLVKSIARDSLMYFLVIFAELTVNTVIWAHENRYVNIIMPWSCALPSILGSHLFLSMREVVLNVKKQPVGTFADHGAPSESYVIETFVPAERPCDSGFDSEESELSAATSATLQVEERTVSGPSRTSMV
ncbi:hypothetical protein DENSPDRAFT_839882 [Dentipellis sp. KUC8613]|nr:hypothetical protein DENSPDRAFT_839882 [Dentipellis sp. KUC8613]